MIGKAMTSWVEVREEGGRKRLYVEGRAFVAVGIQFDFLHTGTVEGFDYLFAQAAKMGVNTIFFPVRWFELEKARGEFDFAALDHALGRCRELGMRMSLLWFGSNQGGGFRCCPSWIREDGATYRRLMGADGQEREALCPLGEAGLMAEKAALEALLGHVAVVDTERRVIFLQVENEPCFEMNAKKNERGTLMDSYVARCHCAVCNERIAAGGMGDWEFAAESMASFFRRLLSDQKRLLPVLSYVNFLLNPQRSGEDLDVLMERCPEIDIVAADYYGFCASDLAFTMRFFDRAGNVPFIAEHSTESCGDAAGNLWRAVCEHGAIAFDPWAIDHTFGWRHWRDRVHERPFVGRDGSWTEAATAYGRSARTMGLALEWIARRAGTPEMMFYVADPGLPRNLQEQRWGMVWRMQADAGGRWAIVRTGANDFTVLGVGVQAVLEPADPRRTWQVEAGRWEDGEWVRTGDAPVVREAGAGKLLELGDGACVRVRLGGRV